MCGTMRLLLLLSAFLTALAGVGTPASAAVRPACAASASVATNSEHKSPVLATVQHRTFGALDRVIRGAALPAITPASLVPLYFGRLRV